MSKRLTSMKSGGIIIMALGLLVLGSMVRGGLQIEGTWPGRVYGIIAGVAAMLSGAAMIKLSRPGEGQYWSLVSVLAVAAVITGAFYYKPPEPQRGQTAANIPLHINGWFGSDSEVTEEVVDILETRDIVLRKYQKGRRELALSVVFAMSNRKVSHPPEQCYKAEGKELQAMRTDWFQTSDGRKIKGKSLLISNSQGFEVVFYWYKAGDMNTGNFLLQQFYVILGNLAGRRGTRVGLIRLSAPIANIHNEQTGLAMLKEFAADLFPELEKHLD